MAGIQETPEADKPPAERVAKKRKRPTEPRAPKKSKPIKSESAAPAAAVGAPEDAEDADPFGLTLEPDEAIDATLDSVGDASATAPPGDNAFEGFSSGGPSTSAVDEEDDDYD